MPQNGIHGLVGLRTARWAVERLPAADDRLAVAVVMGAMLPDIDLYPAAIAFLLGRHDLVYAFHRTLSHSLLILGLLMAAGLREQWRSVCWGLALGISTHEALDLFFWFTQIDLFWPLSHLPPDSPLFPVINLWHGVRIPPVFGRPHLIPNALAAGDFAALALYLRRLGAVAAEGGAAGPALATMQRWEGWCWSAFGVGMGGALVLTEAGQEMLVMTPFLLLFLPYCWGQTLRFRNEIAAWARRGKALGGQP